MFKLESISLLESNDFNFRNLVGILFLLTNANREEKAKEIFRLFDFGANDSLCLKEVEFMFQSLVESILKYHYFIKK